MRLSSTTTTTWALTQVAFPKRHRVNLYNKMIGLSWVRNENSLFSLLMVMMMLGMFLGVSPFLPACGFNSTVNDEWKWNVLQKAACSLLGNERLTDPRPHAPHENEKQTRNRKMELKCVEETAQKRRKEKSSTALIVLILIKGTIVFRKTAVCSDIVMCWTRLEFTHG